MEQDMTTESENRILMEAVRISAEQIESLKEELSMTRAQALIRKNLIEKLKSGPGGIMEMKQTIANKEAEIEELQKDLDLVYAHDSDLIDHLKGWK
jgi:predicted RNase H-like nuclease (RuvC/YqgF family)